MVAIVGIHMVEDRMVEIGNHGLETLKQDQILFLNVRYVPRWGIRLQTVGKGLLIRVQVDQFLSVKYVASEDIVH